MISRGTMHVYYIYQSPEELYIYRVIIHPSVSRSDRFSVIDKISVGHCDQGTDRSRERKDMEWGECVSFLKISSLRQGVWDVCV